ncbi:2-amino-4-hydroxy-6-hydroxymethyldihydropteridine diphosphokinase [Methylomarinovum caldicuralii]|uniref:2-amino-4-hydroxy-6-hydroxymethyldihydropteridine diphosphokinase n=1 Tax=Methylomarinovum caldicuralii TaxID=438856 RepID=A0AAU9CL15_9GAMM|nr:2-amino-4-hydroxy-6-hydroxymethyldihydropteridine diphosphokinase [Methylomarinovum caldicuralii]BCX82351.1 2-amino-4-hydroxy-6-hydroxymethyldihydropteridine diphosphokinase [Methylomarinovum caldicuralii]
MPKVFVSIGSNVDREHHIPEALKELEAEFGPLTASSIYESEAEGFEGPPFHNLVVAFDTARPMDQVQQILKRIERRHGRGERDRKFTSRTLDLDLILYGDEIIRDPVTGKIIVPRDDILKYAFVLEPLAEIAPDLHHPLTGKAYRQLWAKFDRSQARQRRLPRS